MGLFDLSIKAMTETVKYFTKDGRNFRAVSQTINGKTITSLFEEKGFNFELLHVRAKTIAKSTAGGKKIITVNKEGYKTKKYFDIIKERNEGFNDYEFHSQSYKSIQDKVYSDGKRLGSRIKETTDIADIENVHAAAKKMDAGNYTKMLYIGNSQNDIKYVDVFNGIRSSSLVDGRQYMLAYNEHGIPKFNSDTFGF